jgi:lipopolysaccharide transport system ATP-binding protein
VSREADPAIVLSGLGKRYDLKPARGPIPRSVLKRLRGGSAGRARTSPRAESFWALRGVSFTVRAGERVAILGANGAGKSTLLKILSRVASPTEGEARLCGRVAALLEVGVGFNDALTGRENIFLNASLHGLGRTETARLFPQILEFSGLDPRFLDVRVKHYSSGMKMRLAFSVAVHLQPDVLLLDEVVAVGDLGFQGKCYSRIGALLEEGRTLLLVSHSPATVLKFCERAIWLERGEVKRDGPAPAVVEAYRAHYAQVHARLEWTRAEPGISPAAPGPAAPAAPAAAPEPAGRRGVAELISLRLVGVDGDRPGAVRASEALGIEFVFDVLDGSSLVLPSARFTSEAGLVMFMAVYTEPGYLEQPPRQGRYISTLWLPPNLLNVGLVHVSGSLTTPASRSPRGHFERHVDVEHALTFEVEEAPSGTPSARGPYRQVGGVLRPLCRWETRPVEASLALPADGSP